MIDQVIIAKLRKYFTFKNLNIALFAVGSFLILQQVTVRLEPIIAGDCREYILITEAFANRGTPDIRMEDIQSARNDFIELGYNADYFFNEVNELLGKATVAMESRKGIFYSETNKFYGYHFWFYSLINAPANLLMKSLNINPLYAFPFTNALIVIIVFAVILFGTSLTEIQKFLAMVLFITGANAWYMLWIHPEVYSSACIFLSLVCLFEKRFLLSVLLAVLGSFQNPPIAFLIPFIYLRFIQLKGFKVKGLLLLTAISMFTLLPSLFYYYHFGKPNLILAMNFTDSSLIGYRRFSSLLFDLNQGMIAAIPLVLIIFIAGVVHNLIQGPKRWTFLLWLPIIIIFVAIPTIQQLNWNMGSSVVSRYVAWISMIPLIYLIYYFDWRKRINLILMASMIATQVYLVFSFNGFSPDPGHYIKFNRVSKKILNDYPYLYNPDPEIFTERTLQREGFQKEHSPVVYYHWNNRQIRKALVHIDMLDSIKFENVNESMLEEKIRRIKFHNNWAYINFNAEMLKQE